MATRDGIIVTSLLSLTLAFAGCGVGDTNPGPGDGEGAVGLLCTAQLTVTGTFAPTDGKGGGIDPNDPEADWECNPVGTWTLAAQVADQGDCDNVAIESQYVYTVADDETEGWIAVAQGDPNGDLSILKVQTEGPCLGNFEHFSLDGKQKVILKPTVDTEQTLNFSGVGVFELYDKSQRLDPQ